MRGKGRRGEFKRLKKKRKADLQHYKLPGNIREQPVFSCVQKHQKLKIFPNGGSLGEKQHIGKNHLKEQAILSKLSSS